MNKEKIFFSTEEKTPTKHHINDNEATFCCVIYCVEAPFKYLALKQKGIFCPSIISRYTSNSGSVPEHYYASYNNSTWVEM